MLTLGPDVEDGLFDEEISGSPWPVEIGALEQTIATTLGPGTEGRSASMANPVGTHL